MTDSTTKKLHNLRNRDQVNVLKIIRRKDDENEENAVLTNFKSFTTKNILMPDATNKHIKQMAPEIARGKSTATTAETSKDESAVDPEVTKSTEGSEKLLLAK